MFSLKPSICKTIFLVLVSIWSVSCGDNHRTNKEEVQGTGSGPVCEYPNNPLLVIIGEDLSGSFDTALALEREDIRAICDIVSETGRGGQVVVGAVGDKNPKGYVSVEIKPLPSPPKHATISNVAFCKNQAKSIEKGNQAEISSFIAKCDGLLTGKKHSITDINGFFAKVKTLAQQPGSKKKEIWLLINSDGRQDVEKNKFEKLDCSLQPSGVKFYVSNWIEKDTCQAKGKFLNPREFVNFFRDEVK